MSPPLVTSRAVCTVPTRGFVLARLISEAGDLLSILTLPPFTPPPRILYWRHMFFIFDGFVKTVDPEQSDWRYVECDGFVVPQGDENEQ